MPSSEHLASFERLGFDCFPRVVSEQALEEVRYLSLNDDGRTAGERDMLKYPAVRLLARHLREDTNLPLLLGGDSALVSCTLFEKSTHRNWAVPPHQDISIPVYERIPHPELQVWSRKDDCWYVQAPDALLRQMLAIRLHVDECGIGDGPLRCWPASNPGERLAAEALPSIHAVSEATVLPASPGDVIAMRPLTVHASGRTARSSRRRVLHFLFGPTQPGYGLKWPAQDMGL